MLLHYYEFRTDGGHGWLGVPIADLFQYGNPQEISDYSYMRGSTVYLEHDCDAGNFLAYLKQQKIPFNVGSHFDGDRSPVRDYERYSFERACMVHQLFKR